MKLQLIRWEDAAHLNPTSAVWMNRDEAISAATNDPAICISAGFIVEETDHYVLLAQTRSDDALQVSGLFKIPKGWIRKRRGMKWR